MARSIRLTAEVRSCAQCRSLSRTTARSCPGAARRGRACPMRSAPGGPSSAAARQSQLFRRKDARGLHEIAVLGGGRGARQNPFPYNRNELRETGLRSRARGRGAGEFRPLVLTWGSFTVPPRFSVTRVVCGERRRVTDDTAGQRAVLDNIRARAGVELPGADGDIAAARSRRGRTSPGRSSLNCGAAGGRRRASRSRAKGRSIPGRRACR